MKKFVELNEKELGSVEGGFAVIAFQNATGTATPYRMAGATTSAVGAGTRGVKATNFQTSTISYGYSNATSLLSLSAR